MNFLELCQTFRSEAGIAGGGPSSVTDQTGMMLKVVNWVRRAWLSIQAEHPNWDFLYGGEKTVTLSDGVDEYAAAAFSITDFGRWDIVPNAFRIYNATQGVAGERPLSYVPWPRFRQLFVGGQPQSGMPQAYAVTPNNRIRVYPVPDALDTYTITGAYYKAPVSLTDNTDEPAIASDLHWVIIYKALLYYAASEDAPEVYADAGAAYKEWFERLRRAELPPVEVDAMPIGNAL